jgi:hypothetical protein
MHTTAILIACLAAGPGTACGESDQRIDLMVRKLGDLDAKYHGDMEGLPKSQEAYRLLFAAAGAEGLSRIQTVHDDSIAIQSAWEAVTLTVPVEDGPKFYRPDLQQLNWFMGYLQGRARVSPPDWWREAVLDARANRRDNIYHGDPKTVPYHGRTGIAFNEFVTCPKNASVEKKGDAIVYRIGAESVTIPKEIREHGVPNVSGCFTDKYCYLAVHDDVGYPHQLGCVDRASGKLVWKSTVCGSWWGDAEGQFTSWVSVVPTDDGRVFVFGLAVGFYVHGFRASDGKSLVRFSTNFGGQGKADR